MSTAIAIPGADRVKDLMEVLLGRAVSLRGTEGLALDGTMPGALAVYRDESGEVGAIVLADVGLSAFAGAALSLVPAAMAQEAAASSDIPDNLLENFSEVLNVASRLLNDAGSKRQILGEVIRYPQESVPPDAQPLLDQPAQRQDWILDVEGYGSGKMALVTA